MSDQKNPEFEVEEVEDKDLEDVSGGTAELCGGEFSCECCDSCSTDGETSKVQS